MYHNTVWAINYVPHIGVGLAFKTWNLSNPNLVIACPNILPYLSLCMFYTPWMMSPCHHVHISYTTRYYDITYCHVPPLSFILWLSCIIMYVHMCFFFLGRYEYLYNYWHKGKGWEGKGSETSNMVGNQFGVKICTFWYPPTCESFIKGVMTLVFGLVPKMGQDKRKGMP
jgi:hypothetical protein